jgi:hypothetical protein
MRISIRQRKAGPGRAPGSVRVRVITPGGSRVVGPVAVRRPPARVLPSRAKPR